MIEKVELVKEIIVNLALDIERRDGERPRTGWTSLPIEMFLKKDQSAPSVGQIPISKVDAMFIIGDVGLYSEKTVHYVIQ